MIRTQIQLTETQYQHLKRQALEEQCSLSTLVRQAVDAQMSRPSNSRAALYRAALSACEQHQADVDDAAELHDRYLKDSFAR